jgi:hypothetical protein
MSDFAFTLSDAQKLFRNADYKAFFHAGTAL